MNTGTWRGRPSLPPYLSPRDVSRDVLRVGLGSGFSVTEENPPPKKAILQVDREKGYRRRISLGSAQMVWIFKPVRTERSLFLARPGGK